MAKNEARRRELLDAGLAVLAKQGSRGLTHRAVDAAAGVPAGTCVNYFRSRGKLLFALGERVFERLLPTDEALADSAAQAPSRERFVGLMQELVDRVLQQPDLQLALLELRLEATRNTQLAHALTETLKKYLAIDLDFHRRAGLPGGRREVELLHLAIGGLILNLVTLPEVLNLGEQRSEIVRQLVERLVPEPAAMGEVLAT